ncbi:hypothetical protein Plhal703r1_c05g0030931 [Plasmopara halstedii]
MRATDTIMTRNRIYQVLWKVFERSSPMASHENDQTWMGRLINGDTLLAPPTFSTTTANKRAIYSYS